MAISNPATKQEEVVVEVVTIGRALILKLLIHLCLHFINDMFKMSVILSIMSRKGRN
jgi:hypothetical protein